MDASGREGERDEGRGQEWVRSGDEWKDRQWLGVVKGLV